MVAEECMDFFPKDWPREVLLQWKTHLSKKQKYSPNSKCVFILK